VQRRPEHDRRRDDDAERPPGERGDRRVGADEEVDGSDLGMLLSNWGDAPRVPFPPSDCPLNFVNP
jgi:hypothetical protein